MGRARRKQPAETWYGARFFLVWLMVFLGFSALIARSIYLQWWQTDFLLDEGVKRSHRVYQEAAFRGTIFDVTGREIARSVPSYSIWIDAKKWFEADQNTNNHDWRKLASLLDKSPNALKAYVQKRRNKRFVYLKRHIDPNWVPIIQNTEIPGLSLIEETRRYYPSGEIAANLLGITDIDDRGIDGIELAYDAYLQGEAGKKPVIQDAKGRVLAVRGQTTPPRNGESLQLTIDMRIQTVAYQALKQALVDFEAKSGTVVALNAKTGQVLALANSPSFNPNKRDHSLSIQRNLAITDRIEPGSTIKPLVMASALTAKKIRANHTIDTAPGYRRFGNAYVRDSRNYGRMNLSEVMQNSSNVAMSEIAMRFDKQSLVSSLQKFGLGAMVGIGLPGEQAGYLSFNPHMSRFEQATLSFGYGMTVTPLQLAGAYQVLANQGQKKSITLIKEDHQKATEKVLDSKTTRQITHYLQEVVSESGTGKRARIKGYSVAGKTGTVRKVSQGGYGDEYIALFAGFVPASNPEIVMVVMINEPGGDDYYGGQVAAPVFAKIGEQALRILNIAPDMKEGA